MFRRWLCLAMLLFAVHPARAEQPSAAAAATAGVTGTVMLDGMSIPLTHAYVSEQRDIPEQMLGNDGVHLVLLLADRALSPDLAANDQKFLSAALAGQVHGVRLILNGSATWVTSVTLITGRHLHSFTFDEHGGSLRVDGVHRTETRIEAHIASLAFDPAIDVRVATAVTPAPPLPVPLTGRAARQSPPATAFAAVLEAMGRNNEAAIRAGISQGATLSADTVKQLKLMYLSSGTPAALMAGLAKAYVFPDRAKLVFRQGDAVTVETLRREGEAWKLEE